MKELENIHSIIGTLMLLGLVTVLLFRNRLPGWFFLIVMLAVMLFKAIDMIKNNPLRMVADTVCITGILCNFTAILFNGLKMPVLVPAPAPAFGLQGIWRPMVESDHAKFLCDRFMMIDYCFSIGDVLVLFGTMLLIFSGKRIPLI